MHDVRKISDREFKLTRIFNRINAKRVGITNHLSRSFEHFSIAKIVRGRAKQVEQMIRPGKKRPYKYDYDSLELLLHSGENIDC